MRLTDAVQTALHPGDWTDVVVSTVILKEGMASPRIETAMFESYDDQIDYGNPIGVHVSLLDDSFLAEPRWVMDNVRDLEHALAVCKLRSRYAKTDDLQGLFDEMSRFLDASHGVGEMG